MDHSRKRGRSPTRSPSPSPTGERSVRPRERVESTPPVRARSPSPTPSPTPRPSSVGTLSPPVPTQQSSPRQSPADQGLTAQVHTAQPPTASQPPTTMQPTHPATMPPVAAPPPSNQSVQTPQTPQTVRRIRANGVDYFAFDGVNASNNSYFHPLNASTQTFSRYPHISSESGVLHATDISGGKVQSLDLGGSGTFSERRKNQKKAKRPEVVGTADPLGRIPYVRDKTAKKQYDSGKRYLAEPLSPRTVHHMTHGEPHRMDGVTPEAEDSVALTDELRNAKTSYPL